MARNYFTQTTSAKFAAGVGADKTILQLLAGTGVRSAIQAITVAFDGTSNTAQPVLVKLIRQTTAGVGGTARNPVQKDSDIATALLATGLENIVTTEPTPGAIVLEFLIHPQAGQQYPLPLPGEVIVPGAARVGVIINAPAAVNCTVMIEGEE